MDIERREKSPVTQALSVLRGLPSAIDWEVDYSVRQICRLSRTGVPSDLGSHRPSTADRTQGLDLSGGRPPAASENPLRLKFTP